MFYTYQSNRLEILAARLAALLRQPLPSVFAREIIVTQSNGLARWLELRLADHLGIATQLDFQFPTSFLWAMARRVLGQLPATSMWEQPQLGWRLMKVLAELGDDRCYAALHHWLGNGDDSFRRYQLALRIADCFEHYQIYRPQWVAAWDGGQNACQHPDAHWQGALWRQLNSAGYRHRGQVYAELGRSLESEQLPKPHLPQRVSIIGICALAPLYLDLLNALSRHMDVHLFLLNPCQEYWGDIRAPHDLAHLPAGHDVESEYLHVGHPLLASLGKVGRDFIDLLPAQPSAEWEAFHTPDIPSALAQLQADILHLRERGTAQLAALPLAASDLSLQVHICHSAMREVEVLHDQLLRLFDTYPDLRPSDVAVMAPDIARYGPLLEAVFGSAPATRRIPFSIADQGLALDSPLSEAFFSLLDLLGERCDAAQVLGMLEAPAISRRFLLQDADVVRLRHWVREVGIRWGMDAADKLDWALPETKDHTWEAGLERLFLGYAFPGAGRTMYADILPYDQIEGGEAQALGGLQHFFQELTTLRQTARHPQCAQDWVALLLRCIDTFFAPSEEEEYELQLLRNAVQQLDEELQTVELHQPLSLAVFKSALRQRLDSPESGLGRFLGGGVTCCAMLPMRSIPFAVICLLGMDDDAYPRPNQTVSFDLLASAFQRGDRSRRGDDRYLFLETLLSARRCFYLSYTGQSVRDNTNLPPSILVSELLAVVDRSFSSTTHASASAQLTTRHPLQPFSPRYFDATPPYFSYAEHWGALSPQVGRGAGAATILLSTPLKPLTDELRHVSLDDLLHFFKHPTRWLLRERLGIRVEEGEAALPTREPFVLDGLENYQLANHTLELYRECQPHDNIAKLLRGAALLPHAQIGECVLTDTLQRVEVFAGRLGKVVPRRDATPLEVHIELGEFRLSGVVHGMTAAGWVGYRMASAKAGDYLRLWLHHVALNAAADPAERLPSYWVAEDRLLTLGVLAEPQALLHQLLEIYWQGTQYPLHFFPKSSLAYAEKLRNGSNSSEQQALTAARAQWEGTEYARSRPEGVDAYYQLAFADTDPLDEAFMGLSVQVFAPLLSNIQPAADGTSPEGS